MSDIEFVPGLIVKQRSDNAPDYIIGKLSIKTKELGAWLADQPGEWVNVEMKISKSGKAYAAVDNWKPSGAAPASPAQSAPPRATQAPAKRQSSGFDDMDDEIPF